MKMPKTAALLFTVFLCTVTSCAKGPKQVVFEIAKNVSGLIILIDDEASSLTFEKRSDSYHLSIENSGDIEVRDLITLDGHIELSAFRDGKVLPVGGLFFSVPVGASMRDSELSFVKSHGGASEEKIGIWKYSPSSIMNGVRTYAFFVGTLDDAKEALNEMKEKLVAATKEFGKNVLISPEEFERRQRENP